MAYAVQLHRPWFDGRSGSDYTGRLLVKHFKSSGEPNCRPAPRFQMKTATARWLFIWRRGRHRYSPMKKRFFRESYHDSYHVYLFSTLTLSRPLSGIP
jgi:hypothetical protein